MQWQRPAAAIILSIAFLPGAVHVAPAAETDSPPAFSCEIVGVCEAPTPQHGWWDARGEPLPQAPQFKAAKPELGKSIPLDPDQMMRLVVLRARALRGALVQVRIEGNKMSLRLPEAMEGPAVVYSLAHLLVLPEQQQSISFRVGVSAGEWKTVASRPRRPDEGNVAQFDLAEITKGGVRAFDPETEQNDVRVLAEDDAGELHPSQGGLRMTAEGTVLKLGGRFDVPAERIRRFHLQTRPFHWVEFHDVPLQPNTLPETERIRLAGGEWSAADDAEEGEPENPHAKLRWCNVDDEALAQLANVERLRDLDMASPHLTNRGIEHLTALAGLERLRIVGSKINGDALDEIARLKNLRSLELSGPWLEVITGEQLAPLAELRKLRRLKLWDARLTDDGLAVLAGMPQLESLHADGRRITDAGLAHLRRHSNLQTLDLLETGCTDAGLAHLAEFRELKSLDINSDEFTDEGLKRLAPLSGLERLDLNGGQITDVGVQHLAGMTSLDWLDLRGTKVTRAGWRRLRETASEVRCYLPEPKRNAMATVRGRVLDADGRPIAGAAAFCFTSENPYAPGGIAWGPGRPQTLLGEVECDVEGRFELRFARDEAEQYLSFWAIASDGRSGSTFVQGNLDADREHEVRLGDGRVTFRVLDADGEPAAGVRVIPLMLTTEGRGLRVDVPPALLPRLAQTTGEDGRASIVGYNGERLQNVGFTSPEIGMQATGYEIRKHAEKDEIVVLLEPTSAIEGRITTPQEADFSGARFTMYTDSRLEREHPEADITDLFGSATVEPESQGRFTIAAMTPGWLRFIDRTPPGNPVQLRFPSPVKVEPGEPLPLEIDAVDTVLLRGSVLLAGSDDGAADFELRISHGRTGQDWTNTVTIHTDRRGRFEARVIPGEVRIYCVSIHPGYRDVELWKWRGGKIGGYHHVPAGVEAYEAPTIVLAAEVQGAGKLVDAAGEPLSGWSIYGYPSEKPREVTNCLSARTNGEGEFTFAYPETQPPQSYVAYKDGEYHAVEVKSSDPLVLELGTELDEGP